MRLDFDLTPADYAAFHLHHHERRPATLQTWAVVRWLPLVWVALVARRFVEGWWGWFDAGLVLFAAVWIVVYPRLARRLLFRRVERVAREGFTRGATGPQELVLDDEGLGRTDPFSRVVHRWASIDRVEEGPGHLFVYVGANSAVVVPKRTLAPAVVDELRTEIERRRAQAG